jgi:hypothetical protein
MAIGLALAGGWMLGFGRYEAEWARCELRDAIGA